MGQKSKKTKETIYELIVPNSVQEELRKLPAQLQEELLFRHLPSIQADPHQAPFLKGKFRRMRTR